MLARALSIRNRGSIRLPRSCVGCHAKIGPVPKGPLSRDIHVLLIVTLGRLGAAITGDNAPRAGEEGLSIDEQGKRTTSVVHRSMTTTDARSSLCAQNLRSTANMSDKQGRKRAFSRIESSSSRLPSWKKVKNFFRKQTGNGRQAAWAAKRYRSHRTIPPEAILDAPTE